MDGSSLKEELLLLEELSELATLVEEEPLLVLISPLLMSSLIPLSCTV